MLYTLGQMQLEVDGRKWPLACERAHQVLLYLTCQDGWLDRKTLASMFWPEQDDEGARRNLRKALHNIRRLGLIGELKTLGDLVRVDVASDRAQFKRCYASGAYGAAIAWYRGRLGEAMSDQRSMRFDQWLEGERLTLHLMWRQAAHAVLPTLDLAAALDLGRALLDDDGLDEVALRSVLKTLVGMGARSEARKVALAAVDRFRAELSASLSAPTLALIADLQLGEIVG